VGISNDSNWLYIDSKVSSTSPKSSPSFGRTALRTFITGFKSIVAFLCNSLRVCKSLSDSISSIKLLSSLSCWESSTAIVSSYSNV
jgi:hypothetical protein